MAAKLDRVLKRIALAGGFFTIGAGYLFYSKLQSQYRDEFYVTEPVRLLREYPYAEQLLGKPITALNLRFDMVNVKVTPVKTMINIPVRGPKGKAMLYSLCERDSTEDEWEVKKLELQMDPKTPRWTFYRQVLPGDTDNIVTDNTQIGTDSLQEHSLKTSDSQPSGEKDHKKTSETVRTTEKEGDKKKLRWL